MSHDVDEPDQAYQYLDKVRYDILRMIPDDGVDIGSFGCGKAATEAVLVSHGRRVHGVDTSPEAINVARNRLTSARVVHADDEACFEDESIDGLILADVIEHLPRAWDRLTRMTRWVKPGGWVVISVPNMRNYRVLATFVIRGEWPEEQTGIFDQTHVQVITKRRLTRWCESAGLRCEGWFSRLPPRPAWRRRLFAAIQWCSCGMVGEWLRYQHQLVCRRVPSNGTGAGPR